MRRWATNIASLLLVLLVIAIGENIRALHRLDEVLAPHRESLRVICIAAIFLGFAMFMGGILHLLLTQGRPEENETVTSLHELDQAWRDGTWRRKTHIKRFYVITGGVFLASLAAASLLIVTATPGLKFLVILVCLFVFVRIFVVIR